MIWQATSTAQATKLPTAAPPPTSCRRASIASTPNLTSTAARAAWRARRPCRPVRDRFWLSLALTIPVIVYSEMVQEWLGFTPPQFPGSQWVAPVLGTIVFLYGGRPFLEGGVAELRSRQPGMMLLITREPPVGLRAEPDSRRATTELSRWGE